MSTAEADFHDGGGKVCGGGGGGDGEGGVFILSSRARGPPNGQS